MIWQSRHSRLGGRPVVLHHRDDGLPEGARDRETEERVPAHVDAILRRGSGALAGGWGGYTICIYIYIYIYIYSLTHSLAPYHLYTYMYVGWSFGLASSGASSIFGGLAHGRKQWSDQARSRKEAEYFGSDGSSEQKRGRVFWDLDLEC